MKKKETTSQADIIQMILKDHKPIKQLIEILKAPTLKIAKKRPAFEKFAPTLLNHAEAEQESLYSHMKQASPLRVSSFEGDTEHAIAAQLIDEVRASAEEDEWMAKVKVLAEVVEHHVKEEENHMLKKVKKELSLQKRIEIGREYSQLKAAANMRKVSEETRLRNSEVRTH